MMKHSIDKTTMSPKHYYSFKPPRVFWQQTYSLKACFLSILLLLHHLTHLPRQSFHLGKNDYCNAVNPTYISPLSFSVYRKPVRIASVIIIPCQIWISVPDHPCIHVANTMTNVCSDNVPNAWNTT